MGGNENVRSVRWRERRRLASHIPVRERATPRQTKRVSARARSGRRAIGRAIERALHSRAIMHIRRRAHVRTHVRNICAIAGERKRTQCVCVCVCVMCVRDRLYKYVPRATNRHTQARTHTIKRGCHARRLSPRHSRVRHTRLRTKASVRVDIIIAYAFSA